MGLISTLSDGLARFERFVLTVLIAILVGLIILNVATRAFGAAIYWVDETAIYCMIWLVFIGASLTLRMRRHVRVTVFAVMVPEGPRNAMELVIDILLFLFAAFMIWLAWIWYDPPGIMAAGFDPDVFSGTTFNFIYDEPTTTVGIQKFWIWLVMPWFALTCTIHAAGQSVRPADGPRRGRSGMMQGCS
jgi:TRAP-type C4-dicarboxylate transport system permease small subunit